jgi:hypothetical protein
LRRMEEAERVKSDNISIKPGHGTSRARLMNSGQRKRHCGAAGRWWSGASRQAIGSYV